METKNTTISKKQIDIIGHSLGVNTYHARLSNKPKDKFLPDEFYRNYYCVGSSSNFTDDMSNLEQIGFIDKWMDGQQLYFQITEEGINYFKNYFIEEITSKQKPITKSEKKYNEYLDADYTDNFSDFLGIELPEREFSNKGVRLVSTKYKGLHGEFCNKLKDAKLSYKNELRNHLKRA
jgi:hypothetical protein